MTLRELAARELLAELEALDVVLWVDPATRQFAWRDPMGAFLAELRLQAHAYARELEVLLRELGCRDGFVCGPSRWHVAVMREGRLERACDGGRGVGGRQVWYLPPMAPGGALCTRCIRHLVERELARLPRVSPGREERV
jgi:hypothetical protein